jgi:hypothetical protein
MRLRAPLVSGAAHDSEVSAKATKTETALQALRHGAPLGSPRTHRPQALGDLEQLGEEPTVRRDKAGKPTIAINFTPKAKDGVERANNQRMGDPVEDFLSS